MRTGGIIVLRKPSFFIVLVTPNSPSKPRIQTTSHVAFVYAICSALQIEVDIISYFWLAPKIGPLLKIKR